MKIKINTKVIENLKPCKDIMDNWREHYRHFDGDIIEFLELSNITHSDKLWVTLRLIPLEMRVVFALDCAFSSSASYSTAYASYAANADDAASYAAVYYTAYYAADNRKQEEKRQIKALIYLIQGEK